MAEKIKLDFEIDGLDKANKQIADLEKTTADLKKQLDGVEEGSDAFKSINAELSKTTKQMNLLKDATGQLDLDAKFDDVYEAALPLSGRLGELEDRMYALAAAGLQNSDGFRALQEEAVNIRQTIVRVDESIDDLAANKGISTFGSQIAGVGESLMTLDFERAAKQAQGLANNVGNIKFGSVISGVKNLGSVFINLGKALLTNPIFLIAAAIAVIVTAIVALMQKLGILKPLLDAIGKVFGWIGDAIDAVVQGFKDFTDWLGITNNAAVDWAETQAAAAKKASDAQKAASEETIQGLDNQIRMRELEGKATTDLERKKVQELRKTAEFQAKSDRLAFEAAVKKGELSKEEIANLKEVARQSRLAYQQAVDDVKFFEASVKKAKSDAEEEKTKKEKEEEDKRKADRAAAYKERLQKQKEFEAQRLATQRQIEDLRLANLEAGVQKELEINKVKYDRLIQDTLANEKLLQDEKDRLITLYNTQRQATDDQIREADRVKKEAEAAAEGQKELDMLRQQQDLKIQYMAEGQEKEKAQVELGYQDNLLKLQQALDNDIITRATYDELVVAATLDRESQIDAINQEYADKEKARQQALQDQKIQGVKNALSTISSLAELFNNGSRKSAERAFKIQKGVQIATATIDTFKAATSAFSSLSGIPVVGPVLGALAAAAAVAAGLANIKKIASTKFDPEGGGSVPSAPSAPPSIDSGAAGNGGAAPTPPSLTLFGQAMSGSEGAGQQESGSRQQSVVRAVVVESDITNTQNRLATYQQRSEIG